MMPAMPSLSQALGAFVVFFAAPAAAFSLGLLTRALGEANLPALLVMVGEPALWLAMTWLGLHALSHARVLRGMGALVALVAFAVGLRAPSYYAVGAVFSEGATPALRVCAAALEAPVGRLRVATLNTGGVADPHALAAEVRATEADLVVLQELRAPTLARLVEALNATQEGGEPEGDGAAPDPASRSEGLFAEASRGAGMGLLVRGGVFDLCGGAEQDLWTAPLPAAGGRQAQLALAFPRIPELGSLPVLAMHLDRPARLRELPVWGPNLVGSAARVAGFAELLNNPALVVLGDTGSHATFPVFNGVFRDSGLGAVPPRPTWPAQVLGLPSLPLWSLDRVWAGPTWKLRELRTPRTGLHTDHLAVVVELETRRVP